MKRIIPSLLIFSILTIPSLGEVQTDRAEIHVEVSAAISNSAQLIVTDSKERGTGINELFINHDPVDRSNLETDTLLTAHSGEYYVKRSSNQPLIQNGQRKVAGWFSTATDDGAILLKDNNGNTIGSVLKVNGLDEHLEHNRYKPFSITSSLVKDSLADNPIGEYKGVTYLILEVQ